MLRRKTKLIKKSIGKLLKWASGAILGLLISTFIALQLPYIQNRLFGILLQYLSDTAQLTVTHRGFQLKWLHHASLTGLTIKDLQDNTMLTVDQLKLEIKPLRLLVDKYVTLKTVYIQGARVHLCKEGEGGHRGHVLLQRLVGATKTILDTQQATPFVIKQVSLRDIAFSVNDQQAVPRQDTFDANHFTLHKIDAELANLKVQAGTLVVDIDHLTGKHADRPIFVDHFSAFLVVAPDGIQCKALQLRTKHSTIAGDCTLTYDPSLPPAALKDHMHMTARLGSAVIAAEELAVFVPYFKQHKTSYILSCALEGKVNDLHIKDLQFDFGAQGSHLEGCLSLQGLPNAQETIFNMELKQGCLHTQDLLPYLGKKRYKLIEKLKLVKPQGCFYGTLADFIAKATFDTNLGKMATDLKVRVDLAAQRTTYKGTIATRDFELGTWLHEPAMQQLTMQGQIDGEGLNWATAHFQLKANIDKLSFNHHTLEKICVQGQFARAVFEGKLAANSPHLKFQSNLTLNLNKNTESIAVQGVLDRASLQALQLTDRFVTLRAQLSVVAQGLSWDTVKADAKLSQLYLGFEDKEIRLDSLHIHANQGDFGRRLALDSALLALKAEGDFSYASLVSDLKQFMQGYQRRLMHAALPPQRSVPQPCALAYQLHCKNINPLFRFLGIDAYVSPNMQLEGNFLQQEEAVLSLRFVEAVSLAFKKNRLESTQLALYARQSKDGQMVSAVVQLAAKEQQCGRLSTTKDLALAISWQNDQIEFSSSLGQQGGPDRIHLQGQAVLLDSALEVRLTPTQEALADSQWHVHPENRIMLDKLRTQFQNFTFYKGAQQVSLVGILSADPAEVLHLKIKDYSLENLNMFVNKQLAGVLNATAALQGPLGQPCIDGDVTLEKLTVDDVLVGNIYTRVSWDDPLQRLNIACQVNDFKQQTVTIHGFYEPLQEANSLQLTAHFSHAQLAALAPFMVNHLSQLAGELSGTIYIHGSPSSLQLTGRASIIDTAVRINYFNTLYQASGALTFDNQVINITTLRLSDDQQGSAVLQGSLTHKDFCNFQIDVAGSMTNFLLLNTASKDNRYFYGTGALSGSFSASGPLDNTEIYLKAKTDPGTYICIPIRGGRNKVAQYDFIRFVNQKAQNKVKQTKQIAVKGFKLALLLAITPDAHAELILDAKGAEVIRGRGQGNIKLEVDTEGVRTMTGGVEFLVGEYRLSLYRIVNRIFKILPGSKITWHESPTQGILDIKAMYEQRVSLASLMPSAKAAKRARNKYPVQVLVGLHGELLSPDKSFSVHFPAYPSELATVVNEFESKAKQDSKYAETQALSLLLFKEFSHEKITEVGSRAVGKYASILASQPLSNLTFNIDDKLDVDLAIDLAAMERDLNALHLSLSYKLTDRLWVSRKSSALDNTDYASSTALLIGDWTIEHLLTRDGRLRAKLYNRYSANTAHIDAGDTVTSTGGVSLLYTKGFNQCWGLLRGSKRAIR